MAEEMPDDDTKAAVADLLRRVVTLEAELKALRASVGFMGAPPPIKPVEQNPVSIG